ncbi:MAG: 3-isopropylmalate dehydratase small subunit [bacterium]|jgi:3-isopropylmalate/(R)-2-methylmalate dehydratase small subunit
MVIKGKVWRLGDDIDTDVIIPARYLNTWNPAELALHCLEDLDPKYTESIQPGDILVAGKNFGCGSSREHAPIAIKAVGIACVVADSFARIFYRNAINIGLPILECPQGAAGTDDGDTLAIDLEKGLITNLTQGKSYQAAPFPPFMQNIIAAGGLINYVTRRVTNND